MDLSFHQIVFLFFVYSFLGWIIEILFRSFKNKGFINPGFLSGPLLPIYGFNAIILILIYSNISDQPLIVRCAVYFVMISLMEYITGEILVLFFKKRYWDYSESKFNIRGHVCLKFSLIWVVLALIFEKIVFSLSIKFITYFSLKQILYFNIIVSSIVIIDFIFSSGLSAGAARFARKSLFTRIDKAFSQLMKTAERMISLGTLKAADLQIKTEFMNDILKYKYIQELNSKRKKYNDMIKTKPGEIFLSLADMIAMLRDKYLRMTGKW